MRGESKWVSELVQNTESLVSTFFCISGTFHWLLIGYDSWAIIQCVLETLKQFLYYFHLNSFCICDHQTLPVAD